MRWHVALKLLGALLLVAAATTMSLQVHVGGSGRSGRSCGSSLDVLTDRAGWETWYAQDTVDTADGSSPRLLRTLECPDAVNTRSLIAGVLGAAGVAAFVAATALRRSRATAPPPSNQIVRLRKLGLAVTVSGAVLVVAGLAALGVLLANSDATLFVYVGRPLVAILGLIVLAPVLALLVGGRALTTLARLLADRERDDETE